MTPDLVHCSGRESMSPGDRIDLLDADVQHLRVEAVLQRSVNGASIHEFGSVIGLAIGLIEIYRRLGSFETDRTSRCECQILAWARGGFLEHQRIVAAQKASAS